MGSFCVSKLFAVLNPCSTFPFDWGNFGLLVVCLNPHSLTRCENFAKSN